MTTAYPFRFFLLSALLAPILPLAADGAEEKAAAAPAATAQAVPEAKSLDLAEMPVAITSFGAVFHDEAIYFCGGQLGKAHSYSRDEVSKPLYRLKMEPGAEWEELAADEPALGPALLSHSSGLIRIGGMQPRNAKGEEASMFSVPYVRRFDPETGKWSELPDLPQARSSHDAWIVEDKIYVAGGWEMRGPDESSKWSMTVDVLDLSEEKPEWKRIPAPFFRRALATVVLDGELFCMGGLDKGGDTSLEIDILNIESGKWRKGPDLPDNPLKGFGLAAYIDADDGNMYITGFDGAVYRYEKAEEGEGSWNKVGQLKHGRMFGRLVDPPNSPLIILGGAGKGGRPKALESLDFKE